MVIALAAVRAMSSLVSTVARSTRYGWTVAPANAPAATNSTTDAITATRFLLRVSHFRAPEGSLGGRRIRRLVDRGVLVLRGVLLVGCSVGQIT